MRAAQMETRGSAHSGVRFGILILDSDAKRARKLAIRIYSSPLIFHLFSSNVSNIQSCDIILLFILK